MALKKAAYVATVYSHLAAFHLPFMEDLRRAGYEVHAYAAPDHRRQDVAAAGFAVRDIPFSRNPLSPGNAKALKQMTAWLKRERYDIVHVHTPNAGFITRLAVRAVARRRARREYGGAFECSEHSEYSEHSKNNGYNRHDEHSRSNDYSQHGERSKNNECSQHDENNKYSACRVFYTAHGFHFYKGAPLLNWLLYYPLERLAARLTDVLITINDEDYRRAARFHVRGKTVLLPGVGVEGPHMDEGHKTTMQQHVPSRLGQDLAGRLGDRPPLPGQGLERDCGQVLLEQNLERDRVPMFPGQNRERDRGRVLLGQDLEQDCGPVLSERRLVQEQLGFCQPQAQREAEQAMKQTKEQTMEQPVPEPLAALKALGILGALGASENPADLKPFIILCMSELNRNKNQEQLLLAVRLLRDAGIPAVCLLAGIGPLESALRRLAEELGIGPAVRFLGYRSDGPLLMAAADVVALVSRREGLPKVLLEALSASKPVVATDVRGSRDLVRTGENGFLVPVGNAAETAAALMRLYRDSELAERMGARSREMAEPYRLDKVRAMLAELYAEPTGTTGRAAAERGEAFEQAPSAVSTGEAIESTRSAVSASEAFEPVRSAVSADEAFEPARPAASTGEALEPAHSPAPTAELAAPARSAALDAEPEGPTWAAAPNGPTDPSGSGKPAQTGERTGALR